MSETIQEPALLSKTSEPRFRTVHRVVLPVDGDTDILPLYVDFNASQRVVEVTKRLKRAGELPAVVPPASTHQRSDFVVGRNSLRLPAFHRVSLGTYFNAFPASYWRKHTDVDSVRLTVNVDAEATIVVYRSSPRGTANRVDSVHSKTGGAITFDLPIGAFVDGGWYWFDLVAHAADVTLRSADWSVREPEGFTPGTLTVAVTTYNKADYALRHMVTFAKDPGLLDVLDRLVITDQGTDKVRNQEGFADASAALGSKFKLVEQGNIGGSGGFARGMYEGAVKGESTYVMLLDDDVSIETEGVLRAVNFADFTRNPTIVGGHMFNLFERSVLHTFGEQIDTYRYFWGPATNTHESHDFAASNLRTSPWLHRRTDVDYNGWWMCLIPTSIVREIGLSFPVFIKWDDAEYGVRANKHGYSTVSLPGAAVWHMPWTEKDDTIDWQAYYHQRNRWVAAMVYSPYRCGGRMPLESIAVDIRHLLALRYSAVEIRIKALEDVLAGPAHLHRTIAHRLGDVRQIRSGFSDAQIKPDLLAFPPVRQGEKRIVPAEEPVRRTFGAIRAIRGLLRQFTPVRPSAMQNPELAIPSMESKWWSLVELDSALVSASDGSGASWYRRDRKTFLNQLRRSIVLHRRLMANYDGLARDYQAAHPLFTGVDEWTKTFVAVSDDASEISKD